MSHFPGFAINTATFGERYSLFEIGDACARRGIEAISLRRSDIAKLGLPRARTYIRDVGLKVTTISKVGPVTGIPAADRTTAVDQAYAAIDETAHLEADCTVLIAGGVSAPRHKEASLDDIREFLALTVPRAEAANVTISLEPLHPIFAATRGCINSIAEAVDLMAPFSAGVGVTVDVFHLWWSLGSLGEIVQLPKGKIAAFQIADWLENTGDPFSDRGMPGEGVANIAAFMNATAKQGFQGYVDVEVLSSRWAAQPLDVTLDAISRSVADLETSISGLFDGE